jgi:hypothetical protein
MQRILVPALLALTFALPAAAATSTNNGTGDNGATNMQSKGQSTPQIAAQLRQTLADAGFTDIHVMPQSFLVRAKDKQGNPVMMVMNPDSVTAVTAIPSQPASGSNGSGNTQSSASGNKTTKQP